MKEVRTIMEEFKFKYVLIRLNKAHDCMVAPEIAIKNLDRNVTRPTSDLLQAVILT